MNGLLAVLHCVSSIPLLASLLMRERLAGEEGHAQQGVKEEVCLISEEMWGGPLSVALCLRSTTSLLILSPFPPSLHRRLEWEYNAAQSLREVPLLGLMGTGGTARAHCAHLYRTWR